MGTIAEKLAYLAESKEQIRQAIEAQGVPCPNDTPFRQYPEKIRSIGGKDEVGDVKFTARNDLGPEWVLCDGTPQKIDVYPALGQIRKKTAPEWTDFTDCIYPSDSYFFFGANAVLQGSGTTKYKKLGTTEWKDTGSGGQWYGCKFTTSANWNKFVNGKYIQCSYNGFTYSDAIEKNFKGVSFGDTLPYRFSVRDVTYYKGNWVFLLRGSENGDGAHIIYGPSLETGPWKGFELKENGRSADLSYSIDCIDNTLIVSGKWDRVDKLAICTAAVPGNFAFHTYPSEGGSIWGCVKGAGGIFYKTSSGKQEQNQQQLLVSDGIGMPIRIWKIQTTTWSSETNAIYENGLWIFWGSGLYNGKGSFLVTKRLESPPEECGWGSFSFYGEEGRALQDGGIAAAGSKFYSVVGRTNAGSYKREIGERADDEVLMTAIPNIPEQDGVRAYIKRK